MYKDVKKSPIVDIIDIRAYVKTIAEEEETAACRQDMGTIYKLTKTLTIGFQSTDIPIKDLKGT